MDNVFQFLKKEFKRMDYVLIFIIVIVFILLWHALPVHFFADNAEYLYLAKYHFSQDIPKVFTPEPFLKQDGYYVHHLLLYRPLQRIFFTIGYMLGGLNPLVYNYMQGFCFLLLVGLIYKLSVLLTGRRLAGVIAVIYFLLIPDNYKLIHWLGSASLLNSVSVFLAVYYLIKATLYEHKIDILAGIFFAVVSLLSKVTAVFILPLTFVAFLLIYNRDLQINKKNLMLVFTVLSFGTLVILLCNLRAARVVSPWGEINIANIITNTVKYWAIFKGSSMPLFFLASLAVFSIQLRIPFGGPEDDLQLSRKQSLRSDILHRAPTFFLFSAVLFLAVILPYEVVSSKYYTQVTIGMSMFVGAVFVENLFAKSLYKKVLITGILVISVIFSWQDIQSNISRINKAFLNAQISYFKQKNEFARVMLFPQNTTIYVDDKAPETFYRWMLRTMGREDIVIKVVNPKKEQIDRSLFFEGQTIYSKDGRQITDRLGDWRF